MSADPKAIAVSLIRLAADIIEGNVTDMPAAAAALFDAGVSLIPVDQQKQFLTDYDRKFTDLEADVAEAIKLEGGAQ